MMAPILQMRKLRHRGVTLPMKGNQGFESHFRMIPSFEVLSRRDDFKHTHIQTHLKKEQRDERDIQTIPGMWPLT